MESRTYYYARVSSKEQNLDRQIAAFKALGAQEREIITDKESGKNLERTGYQALKNAILRPGDTLVVKSLDRLSRNKCDINKLYMKGFDVELVYDWEQEFLDNKDAPIDKGREIWNKLYRNRKKFTELSDKFSKKGENNERTKVEIEDF